MVQLRSRSTAFVSGDWTRKRVSVIPALRHAFLNFVPALTWGVDDEGQPKTPVGILASPLRDLLLLLLLLLAMVITTPQVPAAALFRDSTLQETNQRKKRLDHDDDDNLRTNPSSSTLSRGAGTGVHLSASSQTIPGTVAMTREFSTSYPLGLHHRKKSLAPSTHVPTTATTWEIPPPKASMSLGTLPYEPRAHLFNRDQSAAKENRRPEVSFSSETTWSGADSQTFSVGNVAPTGCWVLVTLTHPDEPAPLIKYGADLWRQFAQFGQIIDFFDSGAVVAMPSWVALRYRSPWQTAKTLCHPLVYLPHGLMARVQELSDQDPRILQHVQRKKSHLIASLPRPLWSQPPALTELPYSSDPFQDFASSSSAAASSLLLLTDSTREPAPAPEWRPSAAAPSVPATGEEKIILDEYDVLRWKGPRPVTPTAESQALDARRSLCERVIRWLLSIND